MIIIDAFGSIWFANRQVSTLFEYANEELIGESIEMLMPERFQAAHLNHRINLVRNVRVRHMGTGIELVGRRRDGKEFPLATQDLLQPLETLILAHGTLSQLASLPEAMEALAQQKQALRAMSRTLDALLVIAERESAGEVITPGAWAAESSHS
jgi:protein-histidine pros-kinase